jgi:hypothetical protein
VPVQGDELVTEFEGGQVRMSRSPVAIRAKGMDAMLHGGAVPTSGGASDPAQIDGGERDGFTAPAHGAIGDVWMRAVCMQSDPVGANRYYRSKFYMTWVVHRA